MLERVYKIIILIIVFIASFFYFSKDIKEVVFNIDNSINMERSTLPTVRIETSNSIINLLKGYKSNLKANLVREACVPLTKDQTYNILIDENKHVIKKIKYEVRKLNNDLIEASDISVLEKEGKYKKAKVTLKEALESEKEYAIKITLIGSDGNRINYYHRVKTYDKLYLQETLDFVEDFNKRIFNKNEAEEIIKYLEPKPEADTSTLAYVNINSSFDLITWGSLGPVVISEIVPTVKEYYNDIISINLTYIVEANINGAKELYVVREFYRVRYTETRMYLLNYERNLESIFDISLASVSKSELKLGISSKMDIDYLINDDKSKLVFIRNKQVWYYDMEENIVYNVFSFYNEHEVINNEFQDHDIKLLDINKEGDINFIVYGYMGSGAYEGKVGIVLYKYIITKNKVEELVFIPEDKPYELLKHSIEDEFLVSPKDVLYLGFNNSLHTYNITTDKLDILAKDIRKIFISNDKRYIVYQEDDALSSKQISVLDTDKETTKVIIPPKDNNIILYGITDDNIVFGYTDNKKKKDEFGEIINPSYQLNISDLSGNIIKEYKKDGFFISDIILSGNKIELSRLIEDNGQYKTAETDFILNKIKDEEEAIKISTRVTDKALTELYISLVKGYNMIKTPELVESKFSIIKKDQTVRLMLDDIDKEQYYPYTFDGVINSFENISDAIKIANEKAGVVINEKNQIVWERGVKSKEHIVTSIGSYNNGDKAIYDLYNEKVKSSPISGKDSELEDILYYIYKDSLVLIYIDDFKPLIIYGYDSFNVFTYDIETYQTRKIGLNDCNNSFKAAGGRFTTYFID